MQIFQYPFVIITSLAICALLMGIIALYFTMKSVKTANATAEKGFCGIGKIENDFEKAVNSRKNCCVVYVSMSFEEMKRLYPESKSMRILEEIKNVLLERFCVQTNGNITIYDKDDFIAVNNLSSERIELSIDSCFNEINEILAENGAINIVKINFGYHITSSSEVSFTTALGRAKQACSIAEEKDVLYCKWNSSGGKWLERKIKIENNINNEIENNRFFLEYQPIIDAKTNEIVGAEVLSRLNSSTDGVLTPHAFLSAVNNVGLNQKFDYYIFEKNCKWISNDSSRRTKYFFTINFSRSTLCEEDFADNLIAIVEKYGYIYSSLALEILEDKDLTKSEIALMTNNIKRLREKGMLILLDDFGKGYTTFGDLNDFDINIVKIDKSITQNAITKTGFVILTNIIKTAHDLGLKTLCEGIETNEHKELAIKAGCDLLQGYYFHRPMPVAKLEILFEN